MPLVKVSVMIEAWHREAAELAGLNLSHLLRSAVEGALNVNNDLEKEEADIRRQKAIIAAKEDWLAVQKERNIEIKSEEVLESQRRKWMVDHSNFLEAYQKGTLSTHAWQTLKRELKFSSKKQTEEFLQKIFTEGPDYLPGNNSHTQHADNRHFTGFNVNISEDE